MTAGHLHDRPRRHRAAPREEEPTHRRAMGTCGKTVYQTRSEAQRGVRKLQREKKDVRSLGRLIVYLCPTCRSAWHIGHREA